MMSYFLFQLDSTAKKASFYQFETNNLPDIYNVPNLDISVKDNIPSVFQLSI